jgi:hypothetical protein
MSRPLLSFAAAALLAAGALVASEPEARVGLDLRDVPLADALRKIQEATGTPIEAPEALVQGRTLNFTSRGTPAEILNAVGVLLEKHHQLALLPTSDRRLRLHKFVPVAAGGVRPLARSGRLTVKVVEGTVALRSARGSVTVRAGETSSVSAGVLPTEPRPFDATNAAPWRLREATIGSGLEARIPLPELGCRLVGYTDAGEPIVEVQLPGGRMPLGFGELEVEGVERTKGVVEGDELIVPVKLRIKLEKGSE